MSGPTCEQAQRLLLDHLRGELAPEAVRSFESHLANCTDCASALAEEQTVTELLRTGLPVIEAPDRLRRVLAVQLSSAVAAPAAHGVKATSATSSHAAVGGAIAATETGLSPRVSVGAPQRSVHTTRRGWLVAVASLAAAGVLGLIARGPDEVSALPREALNDHLRLLYAQNPVEVPNGGVHQVKPWFSGRVDFAPDISFVGDDEFPMLGGAVGFFVDRKAASFVFKRRLHTISLFVFRSEGLDWPRGALHPVGTSRVDVMTLDGFHLVHWEAEGLGHVLVSDVSPEELLHLSEKLMK